MFSTASLLAKRKQECAPGGLSNGGSVYRLCQFKVSFMVAVDHFPVLSAALGGGGRGRKEQIIY